MNLRVRDRLEYLDVDRRNILNKSSINRMGTWIGLMWLRIGIGGALFGFYKVREVSLTI
jgi:hypothetical protein